MLHQLEALVMYMYGGPLENVQHFEAHWAISMDEDEVCSIVILLAI